MLLEFPQNEVNQAVQHSENWPRSRALRRRRRKGKTLVHMVQVVSHPDIMQAYISKAEIVREDMENREVHNAISLHGLNLTLKDRVAPVAALTTREHLDCLLSPIKHSSEEEGGE